MRYAILALAVLSLSACDAPQTPSKSFQITRFEFAPTAGKAPLSGDFIVEVKGDDLATCEIEPSVRSVQCNGRKAWIVTTSGDYILRATSSKGVTLTAVARVTIQP
jgi:hypothetical protein